MSDTQNIGSAIPVSPLPPEYFEKKAIKRDALHIGAALLVLMSIMFFWSFPVVYIALLFGVSTDTIYATLSDPMILQIIQIIVSVIMVFLPFLILGKAKTDRLTDIMSFRFPKRGLTLRFICAGVAFCLFVSLVTGIAGSIFEGFGIKIPNPEQELPTGIYGITAVVISTVLIPAFIEEFAMRGVVLGLLRKYGDTFAVFASALVFGIMHANIYQIPFAFLLGAFFGIIVIKTESLWPAILLHGINNGISVAFGYIEIYFSLDAANLAYILFFCAALLLAIIGIVWLLRKDSTALSISGTKTVTDSRRQAVWFTLSPLIIITIIVAVVFGFVLR